MRTAPKRLTSRAALQACRLVFSKAAVVTAPALLTSTRTGPRAASASATARATEAASITSQTTAPPPARPSAAAASTSAERPMMVTAWPPRLSASATARPMPVPPPVTMAWPPLVWVMVWPFASAGLAGLLSMRPGDASILKVFRRAHPGNYFRLEISSIRS